MTFLSTQSFDENGEISVFKKKRNILESVEASDDGSLKGTARVKIEKDVLTKEDVVMAGNLRAAEAHVLEEGNVFWGMSTPPLNHVDRESWLAHRISMAAANIAGGSTRGMGNTVVCHPDVREKVDACWDKIKTVNRFNPLINDTMEVEEPYFPAGPLEIIENDMAPDDSVLVLYRGVDDGDQPLIYVEGEGLLFNNKVAAVENYGKFVRIP